MNTHLTVPEEARPDENPFGRVSRALPIRSFSDRG